MKRLTTLFTFLVLVSFYTNAVAIHEVQAHKVACYNFSAGSYDMANHILTVGNTQYNVNSLTILSGALATTAGMYTELELPTYAPTAAGSIALWAPGTSFPNPMSALMVSYVAWGAAGQAYEAEAVASGHWQVGAFVNYSLPIKRHSDYSGSGPGYWYSTMRVEENALCNKLELYPLPFQDELNLKFEQGHGITDVNLYNLLGQLVIHKSVMQQSAALTLATQELANGVYLLEAKGNKGQSQVRRVIKR